MLNIEQREKIKNHFHNNKKVYIAGGVCLVVGAATATLVIYTRSGDSQTVAIKQLLNWKSTLNAPIVMQQIPRAGHAGKILQERGTDNFFMSVRKLANELGVSPKLVRKYLAGEIPDLMGRQFDLIADGAPDLVVSQLINA